METVDLILKMQSFLPWIRTLTSLNLALLQSKKTVSLQLVGGTDLAKFQSEEIEDCEGKVLMPGMVNTTLMFQ